MTLGPDIDHADLGLLEAHLDGELPAADEEALARRLAADPGLDAALSVLRDERAARAAAWSSYEPGAGHAEAAAAAAVSAARRVDRTRAVVFARRCTAAAAVVLVAFASGWVVRGRVAPERVPDVVVPAAEGAHGDARPFVSSGSGDGPPFPATRRRDAGEP